MSTDTAPTTTGLPLAPGRWELDADHSTVGFSIRHLGVSKVRGRFRHFTVDFLVGETLGATSLAATIDVGSLDTGNAERDSHVLSPDLLDVARRPRMECRSTRVRGSGHEYQVDGELTIGEVTRPVTLAVELGGLEVNLVDGHRRAGLEATAEIRRKDFGIDLDLPPGILGEVVKVELDIQLVEPAQAGSTA